MIKFYGLDQNGPEPLNHFTEVATASTQTSGENYEQSETSSVPIMEYGNQSSRTSLEEYCEDISSCSDRLESLERLSSSYGDQNEDRDLELALEMSRLVHRMEILEVQIEERTSTNQVEQELNILRRKMGNIEEFLDEVADHLENSEASAELQNLDDVRSEATGKVFRNAIARSNQLRKNRQRRYE